VSLLLDDECRVCFHVHPGVIPCMDIAHDPGPDDTDIESVCGCDVYVDLEAESRIVVHVHDWQPLIHEPTNQVYRVECSGCHKTPYEILGDTVIPPRTTKAPV